ncbi:MAG: PLP-dependent aminotransferase family protein, partial [Candidatus Binatia bacterium]
TYISPPFLPEAIVWEFIRRGHFEPNLERVRAELRARRDAMLDALALHFARDASWSTPNGGYFVWLDLDGTDSNKLASRAEAAGVAFVAGSAFFPRGSGLGGSAARLAFSYEPPERIAEGIELLASLR